MSITTQGSKQKYSKRTQYKNQRTITKLGWHCRVNSLNLGTFTYIKGGKKKDKS